MHQQISDLQAFYRRLIAGSPARESYSLIRNALRCFSPEERPYIITLCEESGEITPFATSIATDDSHMLVLVDFNEPLTLVTCLDGDEAEARKTSFEEAQQIFPRLPRYIAVFHHCSKSDDWHHNGCVDLHTMLHHDAPRVQGEDRETTVLRKIAELSGTLERFEREQAIRAEANERLNALSQAQSAEIERATREINAKYAPHFDAVERELNKLLASLN